MILKYLILWVILESTLTLVFFSIEKLILKKGITLNLSSISKGMLERLMLILGLINGYPQIITAFVALKIAHKISSNKVKSFDDFFLLGNIISVSSAIIFVWLIN